MNSVASKWYVYPSESYQNTTHGDEDQIRSIEVVSIGEKTKNAGNIAKKISVWAEDLIVKGQFRAKGIHLSVFNLTGAENPLLSVKPDPQEIKTLDNELDGKPGTNAGDIDLLLYSLSSDNIEVQLEAQGGSGQDGQNSVDNQGGNGGLGGSGGNVTVTYLDPHLIVQQSVAKAINPLLEKNTVQILADLKGLNINPILLDDGTTFGSACTKLAEIFMRLFPQMAIQNIVNLFNGLLPSRNESEVKILTNVIQELNTALSTKKSSKPISEILQPLENEPFKKIQLDKESHQTMDEACQRLKQLFEIFLSPQETELKKKISMEELLPIYSNINNALLLAVQKTKGTVASSISNSIGISGRNGDGPKGVVEGNFLNNPHNGMIKVNPVGQITKNLNESIDPVQLMMLVQKAGLCYFMADPTQKSGLENLQEAAILLNRLAIRLKFMPDLMKDDNTYKSDLRYQTLVSSYQSVTNWQKQLSQGLDFYGNSCGYVPLLSYSTYSEALDKLIDNFKQLEDSYHAYFLAEKEDQKKADQFQKALSQQESIISQAAGDLEELKNLGYQTAYDIFTYTDSILQKRKALDNAIQNLKDDISSYFNFNWKDFLNACSMIAFAPSSSLMYMTQVGTIVYNAEESVTQDDGIEVNKDYLVAKMQSTSASLDTITESYSKLKDGSFQPEDPGANKIIVEQQDFFKFLDNFQKSFPNKIDSIKKIFLDYVGIITDRNNKILHYNAIVKLMKKTKHKIDEARKIKDLSLSEKSLLQPDLPFMTAYMSKVYIDARAQIMQVLYTLSKAYEFWSLIKTNFLASDLPPSGLNHAELVKLKSDVIEAKLKALNSLKSIPQNFPKYEEKPGLLIRFDDPHILDTFKKSNVAILSVSEVRETTNDSDSPLAKLSDIRIKNVRAWLRGAKIKENLKVIDALLKVNITHTGKETIVSQENQVFQFYHDPLSKEFIYYSNSKEIFSDTNFGGNIENNEYAMIGPFTTWRIELDTSYSIKKSIVEAIKENILQKDMGINYPGKTTLSVASITQENEGVRVEIQNIVGSVVKTLTVNVKKEIITDSHTNEDLTNKGITVVLPSHQEVDLSDLEAIELEFTGKYYPFLRQ